MIEASDILDGSLVFVAAWLLVVLLHGAAAARDPQGNPLPPEPELHHDDH